MSDAIDQKDFYGKLNMHYMAAKADTHEDANEWTPDYLHNKHLTMQESMSHPIVFHAQMTGDIMCLHQALQQPDAAEFVKAVIKVQGDQWSC